MYVNVLLYRLVPACHCKRCLLVFVSFAKKIGARANKPIFEYSFHVDETYEITYRIEIVAENLENK